MTTPSVQKSGPFLSKRRLGWAGVAAVLGCAACCSLPLLAAAGLGSGAVATLSSILRPGSELLVGGTVFVVVLGVMAIRNRMSRASGCGPSCRVDGSCCDNGTAAKGA
jgi:hypothetical protein